MAQVDYGLCKACKSPLSSQDVIVASEGGWVHMNKKDCEQARQFIAEYDEAFLKHERIVSGAIHGPGQQ